jgi:hypothetical protein
VQRLVVAGDLLELRHAPPRVILERAAPFLARLGEALGPDRELLLLAGNHDHRVVRPWLHDARMRGAPLAVDADVPVGASPLGGAIAEALGGAGGPRLRVSYPAAWLSPPSADGTGGILVSHGHYVDALWRMPTFERLSAGLAARSHGTTIAGLGSPADFERLLAPGYGWMDALADHADGTRVGASQKASATVWVRLNERGTWSGRGLRLAVPRAIALLRRLGFDGLDDRLTPDTLRVAGLRGMDRVADRLGVRPAHLIVGHTHRAGPLPGDAAWEWRLSSGGQLWNTGSWVHAGDAPGTGPQGPGSPYWPGRGIRIDADGVPRLLELLPLAGPPAG